MSTTEPTGMLWRKSSHSNGQANCVEVTILQTGGAAVAIRDSKAADGQCLIFTTRAWRQLINNVEASVSRTIPSPCAQTVK